MHEKIDVLTAFMKGTLKPLIIKWRGKKYTVEKVHMQYEARDGRETIHYFSVADNANYFKLAFYTRSLTWYLEELYSPT